MTNTNYAKCPRCGDPFDVRCPAGSRATEKRDVEICKWCGSDETVGRGVYPVAEWPIGPNLLMPLGYHHVITLNEDDNEMTVHPIGLGTDD